MKIPVTYYQDVSNKTVGEIVWMTYFTAKYITQIGNTTYLVEVWS
jgi:hypothetical protein